ncbi:unnamed protein product [Lathyrus sativus]|nr:unnamed protein product [Lathyrus sativus]
MEALTSLHHRHQPLCSSLYPSLTSSSSSSLFLSQSSPSSSSIRASSSSSSSDSPLREAEPKSPQFFNPNRKIPNVDPTIQDPERKSPQFLNPIRKLPSFATVTAAASAFLFLGYCQNAFNKPITPISSVVSVEEKSGFEEFSERKPDHVQSVLHLKLKEKIPVVHSFKKVKTDDDEAWQVLRGEVFSCSENLELIKMGFEEILEKDMDCNKVHQNRVLEYLEMVDECNSLLKGIMVSMNIYEREDVDKNRHLRFFCEVVDQIRVLEGDMVGALKYFKQLEQ